MFKQDDHFSYKNCYQYGSFFRVIFDGFVFILFHEFKWYFHPVFVLFLCSFYRFLYCFQTTLRLLSYNFYTVFALLHPIFDVFSQYMRAIAFLLLWYFNTIFKVFLLYLQIRVFY